MQQAVICIARDATEAAKIVDTLQSVGFSSDDISVEIPDTGCAQELGFQKHSKAPEGIACGAALGSLVGSLACYLIVAGVFQVPSYTLESQELLTAVLNGVALGGLTGGAFGGLIGLTVPELEVVKYHRKVRYGSTLIAVHADNYKEVEQAEKAVKSAGCELIECVDEVFVRQKAKA